MIPAGDFFCPGCLQRQLFCYPLPADVGRDDSDLECSECGYTHTVVDMHVCPDTGRELDVPVSKHPISPEQRAKARLEMQQREYARVAISGANGTLIHSKHVLNAIKPNAKVAPHLLTLPRPGGPKAW